MYLYRRRLRRITDARCPLVKRLCGQTLGPSWAKLSDYAFPQPLWKLFGEHLGEDEAADDDDEKEEEKETSGGPLGALFLGLPGGFLGASWRPLGGFLGVLGGLWGPLGGIFAVLGHSCFV